MGIGITGPATELHVNGTITGNALGGAISDANLKENVKPFTFKALNLVNKLRPVKYDFITPTPIKTFHTMREPPRGIEFPSNRGLFIRQKNAMYAMGSNTMPNTEVGTASQSRAFSCPQTKGPITPIKGINAPSL